ncbi:MAG: hypothetical protein PUI06_04050 [Prevotella sp.]|nr:hypothetical protein [Prevotella sp.]MDY5665902.1 hypothetical protein [Alloprevotella sp.]
MLKRKTTKKSAIIKRIDLRATMNAMENDSSVTIPREAFTREAVTKAVKELNAKMGKTEYSFGYDIDAKGRRYFVIERK